MAGRRINFGFVAIIAVIIALAIYAFFAKRESLNIAPVQLKSMLDSKSRFRLIDVRQPSEFAVGHIAGAELLPLSDIQQGKYNLDKSDTIILYCRSGRRSGIAARILKDSGYEYVRNLEGGILKWEYGLVSDSSSAE
jgi:rhodanese-related sulfurtransferase